MKKLLLSIGILFFGLGVQSQIVVNDNPYPLIECDDDNDGYAYFNLHQADADISLGDTSLYFTYHKNQIDAEIAINALISPYMNEVIYTEVVFARAEDTQGIFAVVELELQVVEDLPITEPIDLFQIDDDGDGFAIFDLTENDAIVLEGLNPAAYMVSYYETEENAEMDEYVIANPTAYQNISQPQFIYVRVENISGSCVAIDSFLIMTRPLSVDSFGFENLNIFPNPSSGSVTIQSSQLVSDATISLYDILGKRLLTEKMVPQNGSVALDVSSFENGVYFVKIASGGNVVVRKLIKG